MKPVYVIEAVAKGEITGALCFCHVHLQDDSGFKIATLFVSPIPIGCMGDRGP